MPRNVTLKDLENFLSTPRIGGGLSKAASALRRAEEERQSQRSVFNQPREPEWQPDHVRPGGHALEAPMISPDDLFGTGIPTKIAMALKGAAPLIGGLGVIKNKGGNWLSGSVEGALSGLKRAHRGGEDPADLIRQLNERIAENPNMTGGTRAVFDRSISELGGPAALNSFIDKQLTRYVKNEMATPEDPIRALAERGVLHSPDIEQFGRNFVHPTGEHYEKLAKNPLAQAWENASDNMLRGSYHPNPYRPGEEMMVFSPKDNTVGVNLGFSHLTDELANALNPESGLPRHLLLDPKSMDRVSVPQAVERVAAINAWRAAQKAEADALRANNAATVLHKEYPEKGMKWVELKQGDLPEGWSEKPDALTVPQIYDAAGERVTQVGTHKDPRRKALQDALKYEGDTMGHCVGGYCDDVASGRTKIYSLRDAKGQPHVTIEVEPSSGFDYRNLPPEIRHAVNTRLGRDRTQQEFVQQEFPEHYARLAAMPTARIKQIKGKQNRAPNEEYLPFVQDFVKSGKWSDVGDLQNTGLQRAGWAPDVLERMKAHGIEAPEYGTADEINAALNALNKAKGFAHGGTVDKNNLSVQQLQAIIASLRQGHLNA